MADSKKGGGGLRAKRERLKQLANAAATKKKPPAEVEAVPEPEPQPVANDYVAPAEPAEPDLNRWDPNEAIAPLWDQPHPNDPAKSLRIPQRVLSYTVVYRVTLDEQAKETKAHCGNLPPSAGLSDLKRQFGPGRYFLQARIGQRIGFGRYETIDGAPFDPRLPFGPVGELPSGLVTLTQGDTVLGGFFAMFQMQIAQQREDFQRVLQMMFDLNKSLATQYGAANVATHLRDDNAALRARVKELEEGRDKNHKENLEFELEKLKFRLKKEPEWKEALEAVGDVLPAIVEKLPPKAKATIESFFSAPQELPPGVTEHK